MLPVSVGRNVLAIQIVKVFIFELKYVIIFN